MNWIRAQKMSNYNKIQLNAKNSLIEFYRFLFAMWVVWYHGYFIFKNQHFGHGYIAVEFFFILSGFYLMKSINRYNNKNLFVGLGSFLWKRTKSLGLPFVVGLVFVFWYMIFQNEISWLGYLWYIPFMFLAFATIYILNHYVKNEKIFLSILLTTVVVSYLLLYIPILKGWGLFRALGGVSLGVLISYLPKINLKTKFVDFNLIITIALLFVIVCLAYLPKRNYISEYFLVLLLIPALIYFTSTQNIHCKFFNFLGSLSFGLYAYQCVLRVLELYFPLPQYLLFLILVELVLIDRLIILIMGQKNKQILKQTPSLAPYRHH